MFGNYDAWLEAPYQTRAADDAAYVDWCESRGLDPDEDHLAEFEEAVDSAAEDAAAERAEALRDDPDWDL